MSGFTFTKDFWVAASERALKTFAQVLSAVLLADGFNLLSADWVGILSATLTAVVLSFLTSIGSMTTSPEPSPALFGKEHIPAAAEDLDGLPDDEPVGVLSE